MYIDVFLPVQLLSHNGDLMDPQAQGALQEAGQKWEHEEWLSFFFSASDASDFG